MTSRQIETRLRSLGQGSCLSCWNGSFDVQKLDSPEVGRRRVLASASRIDEALFDQADLRAKELKDKGVHFPT